jgi:hypothetical protein
MVSVEVYLYPVTRSRGHSSMEIVVFLLVMLLLGSLVFVRRLNCLMVRGSEIRMLAEWLSDG